jgi:hypothetical protein
MILDLRELAVRKHCRAAFYPPDPTRLFHPDYPGAICPGLHGHDLAGFALFAWVYSNEEQQNLLLPVFPIQVANIYKHY